MGACVLGCVSVFCLSIKLKNCYSCKKKLVAAAAGSPEMGHPKKKRLTHGKAIDA